MADFWRYWINDLLIIWVALFAARRLLALSRRRQALADTKREGAAVGEEHLDEVVRLRLGGPSGEDGSTGAEHEAAEGPWARLGLLLVAAGLLREPLIASSRGFWSSYTSPYSFEMHRNVLGTAVWLLPAACFLVALRPVASLRQGLFARPEGRPQREALLALALAGGWLRLIEHWSNLRGTWSAMVRARRLGPVTSAAEFPQIVDLALLAMALILGQWAFYRTVTWIQHDFKRNVTLGRRRQAGWALGLLAWGAVADGFLGLTRPILAAVFYLPPIADRSPGISLDPWMMTLTLGLPPWAVLASLLLLVVAGSLTRPVLDQALLATPEPLPDPADVRLLKELAAIGLLTWLLRWSIPIGLAVVYWGRMG